jgi:hypothetical protein
MDLDAIIPKNGEWKLSKGRVYKRNIAWLPIFDIIDDNEINIFLDIRHSRDILKIIKNSMNYDIKMNLISPLFADPGQDTREYDSINITNIIRNYSRPAYFDGFEKINFDIIAHLIDYCKNRNCIDLVKDIYLDINKNVQGKSYDYYTGKEYPNVKNEKIRETFRTLYREIQLQQILK